MDNFNYLAVLISIVLGLGITQLLSGFGRWIESRSAAPAYAPTVVWAVMLLVMHVQTWWSMYGMRYHEDWTFLEFVVVLLQPIVLYLLATITLPNPASATLDLKSSYFAQRRWFFGLLIALLFVSVGRDIALTGALPSALNLLFHALFVTLAICGIIAARESIHRFIAFFSATVIVVYIALLFSVLR